MFYKLQANTSVCRVYCKRRCYFLVKVTVERRGAPNGNCLNTHDHHSDINTYESLFPVKYSLTVGDTETHTDTYIQMYNNMFAGTHAHTHTHTHTITAHTHIYA